MAPQPTIVQRAEAGDAGEILCLQRAAYQSEALLYGTPRLAPLTQTLDELRRDLDELIVLTATIGERIVGSVRARVEGRTAFVGRLIVAPDLQRQGIGTRLMAEIEALLGPQVARFELFTGDRSEGNLTLYRRLGYTPFGRRPDIDGVTLVFLEKTRPA
jgi:ribosomal protein S18 acetylase RimI-like enzyme